MNFQYPDGATPLTKEEREGLKLPHVSNRDQLNKWEQEGILQAELKYFARKRTDILSEAFILKLHKDMFGGVWKWAGKYRKSDKNIGVPFWDIPSKLKELIEDISLWVKGESGQADWIAARFHHRLVSIHPFANGNGRHARLMADLMLVHILNRPRFTWGGRDLAKEKEIRPAYLSALRQADQRNYQPLLTFVRS